MRLLPPRVLSFVVLTLAASALPSGAALAGADDAGNGAATAAVSGKPRLPRPAQGSEAIRLLGEQLPAAAALNGWTPGQLRHALATDATAWVDPEGRVLYKDVPHTDSHTDVRSAPAAGPQPAPLPLADTFLLHSKPDSDRTLLIDFDGSTVSNTAWNTSYSLPNGFYPAWTLDGDPSTFSATEREAIQSIWQRVAEDYAPFDIDVTTEDPGQAALVRTDQNDQVYGTRALVSPSTVAEAAICGTPLPKCGGVAYTDVFGVEEPHGSRRQPAWVFPQSLGPDNTKSIAEAVSHEVGHNFSLQHDGRLVPQEGYYAGHAMWAPIMGNGYNRPLTQWSKGEYAGANNLLQDDVALIAARAPYRTDEAGGTVATAAPAVPVTGYVTDRSDTDTFALGRCSGTVTIQATGAAPSPNLDIRLELLDSAGRTVASADPASVELGPDSAGGLAASVSSSVTTGAYYARVDGVGNGTGLTGYTDYGSIGAYSLAISGCAPPGATTPSAPTGLTVSPAADGRSATVSWSPPASDGGSAITGYTLTRTGGGTLDVGPVGSHTWTGLTPGATYTFTVAAKNAVGPGPAASKAATMPDPPAPPAPLAPPSRTVPGAPTIGKATSGRPGGKRTALFRWAPPGSTGGQPLTGYEVQVRNASGRLAATVSVGPSATSLKLKAKRPGRYKVVVVAVNAAGSGAPSAASKAVRVR